MELSWDDIDTRKISKDAWDTLVLEAERYLSLAVKLHHRRSSECNLALQPLYEDMMDRYASSVRLLSFVAPGYIYKLYQECQGRAENLEKAINTLWGRPKVDELVERHVRVLDQVEILRRVLGNSLELPVLTGGRQ